VGEKLVRDKVPAILRAEGQRTFLFHRADAFEAYSRLRRALDEVVAGLEATTFPPDSAEKPADVLEVLYASARFNTLTPPSSKPAGPKKKRPAAGFRSCTF
jgi:predicted house-cleaning noncanonical NTP pyrophosphatase (MazG superfamily)